MEHLINTVHHADCFDLLAMIPDGAVDAIITDLPYGQVACSWDTVIPFEPMWAAVKRVLKPRGVFVTTASQPFTSALVMSNPKWFKYEIIWEKGRDRIANYAMQNVMPGKIHENILVFSQASIAHNSALKMTYHPVGAKVVNRPKIYDYGGSKGGSHLPGRKAKKVEAVQLYTDYPTSVWKMALHGIPVHPTQKPVPLYERLIRTYTQPDELVLDFACGSGTTALAARNTGRRFIAGDSSAEYVAIARDRLRMPFEPRQVEPKSAPLEDLPLFAIGD